MKYIYISADTCDADYIRSLLKISEDELPLIKNVVKAIKIVNEKIKEGKLRNCYGITLTNFPTGEHRGSLESIYIETGLLTEEELEEFKNYVPYGPQSCDIHTIDEIKIIDVKEEEILL